MFLPGPPPAPPDPLALRLPDYAPLREPTEDLVDALLNHNNLVRTLSTRVPAEIESLSRLIISRASAAGLAIQTLVKEYHRALQLTAERLETRTKVLAERNNVLEERNKVLEEKNKVLEEENKDQHQDNANLRLSAFVAQHESDLLRADVRYIEQLMYQRPDPAYGTTRTAAEAWRDRPGADPVVYTGARSVVQCEGVLEAMYDEEAEMYEPFVKLLNQLLEDERVGTQQNPVIALDTHKMAFLGNRKPDITIQVVPGQASSTSLQKPVAALVVTLIEVKYPPAASLDPGDRGQLLDQLLRLMNEQPWRDVFWGLLTSFVNNCWMCVRRRPGSTPGYEVSEVIGCALFPEALSFLLEEVLGQGAHQLPDMPAFSPCFSLTDVIGVSKHALVGTFPLPAVATSSLSTTTRGMKMSENVIWVGDDDATGGKRLGKPESPPAIAVKRTRTTGLTLENEITVLKDIHSHRTKHPCDHLPRLICYDREHLEVGVSPVGTVISTEGLMRNPGTACSVMDNVFDALGWLHDHGWIHRDVRWENVVLTPQGAVLIDLGSAIKVPPAEAGKVDVPYFGGYVCCPPRVLNSDKSLDEETYCPRIGDDYTAFVLLLVALLVPRLFTNMRFSLIVRPRSSPRSFLIALWQDLAKARFWSAFVKTAMAENASRRIDFHNLREMCPAILCLPSHTLSRPTAQMKSTGSDPIPDLDPELPDPQGDVLAAAPYPLPDSIMKAIASMKLDPTSPQ